MRLLRRAYKTSAVLNTGLYPPEFERSDAVDKYNRLIQLQGKFRTIFPPTEDDNG